MSEQKIVYSFAWFQLDQWLKLKETVEDPTTLDDCYEDWRRAAESAISEIRANGHSVQKMSIKIDALLEWCNKKNIKMDSEARAEYVAYLAQKKSSHDEI